MTKPGVQKKKMKTLEYIPDEEEKQELMKQISNSPQECKCCFSAGLVYEEGKEQSGCGCDCHYSPTQKEAQLLEKIKAERDDAYSERNQLVAHLSKSYAKDSYIKLDPADPKWPIVYIQTPQGQLSWHIPYRELKYFKHLRRNSKIVWDGHTTEEKYRRLYDLISATPPIRKKRGKK